MMPSTFSHSCLSQEVHQSLKQQLPTNCTQCSQTCPGLLSPLCLKGPALPTEAVGVGPGHSVPGSALHQASHRGGSQGVLL